MISGQKHPGALKFAKSLSLAFWIQTGKSPVQVFCAVVVVCNALDILCASNSLGSESVRRLLTNAAQKTAESICIEDCISVLHSADGYKPREEPFSPVVH